MKNNRLIPMVLAVAGFVTIVVGVHQGLVHVAPGYEGTIMSGWDGALNHDELLLVQLGGVGIGGTVAALRWKRLASIPVAVGSIVLFYAFRAVLRQFQASHPLYQEYSLQPPGSQEYTVMIILGAEPFLLVAGGLLLIGAGIAGSKLEPLWGKAPR